MKTELNREGKLTIESLRQLGWIGNLRDTVRILEKDLMGYHDQRNIGSHLFMKLGLNDRDYYWNNLSSPFQGYNITSSGMQKLLEAGLDNQIIKATLEGHSKIAAAETLKQRQFIWISEDPKTVTISVADDEIEWWIKAHFKALGLKERDDYFQHNNGHSNRFSVTKTGIEKLVENGVRVPIFSVIMGAPISKRILTAA